ncbi:OmpH family outer membrane protein [Thioclava sp. GXIMD4215]|uniref:OmpH family outer membrane protein n=1 Tax=Thioclava sp. GXIMD4215 TaxID=3131928 RepID=UPI0032443089
MIGAAALFVLPACILPVAVMAQDAKGVTVSRDGAVAANMPILTLDWEELYQKSAWARRVKQQLAQESTRLAAENKRIADDLIEEEKTLTRRRATMTPEAFRSAADAFDEKATGIRAAQKAKAEALARQVEAEQQAFLKAALPLLDDLLQQKGAQIVIDRRVIIRGLAQIDVTDDMLEIVDSKLGTGEPQPVPKELGGDAPDPPAQPAPASNSGTAPDLLEEEPLPSGPSAP